ncbi:MAG: hypothetical protein AVO35_08425 [Candidatus Aegiribacteria sp. MLS_C]|nr:MAG: hypothetical protein AVO35_08425 [Candidatus Aegiribacteria sp. MLS_C]
MKLSLSTVSLLCSFLLMLSCGNGSGSGSGAETAAGDEEEGSPNVLLLIIDTLRADHLSCYGYHRETSSCIDSLAASGTRWKNCVAQAPWTPASVASIMSGLTVREHAVGRHSDGDHGLAPDMPVMSVLFSEDGYRTCGIFNVAHFTVLHGYARGFDHHTCNEMGDLPAEVSINEFLEWLQTSDREKPFLAVLHLFDPHHPYDPPDGYRNLYLADDTVTSTRWQISEDGTEVLHPEHLEHYLAWYDGEIRYLDDQLSLLFRNLREMGYGENTIVVLAADHGEEFLERGWVEHGHQYHQEMIHVPLIASGPGIPPGEVVEEYVGNFDILPTLAALCGIETEAVFSGVDLLGDETLEPRPIPSGRQMAIGRMLDGTPVCAVTFDGFKGVVISREETEEYFMFDLLADPGETVPLPADSNMVRMLDYYRSTPALYTPRPLRELEQSTTDALRDLGYF